jgi:hypothetical protein
MVYKLLFSDFTPAEDFQDLIVAVMQKPRADACLPIWPDEVNRPTV